MNFDRDMVKELVLRIWAKEIVFIAFEWTTAIGAVYVLYRIEPLLLIPATFLFFICTRWRPFWGTLSETDSREMTASEKRLVDSFFDETGLNSVAVRICEKSEGPLGYCCYFNHTPHIVLQEGLFAEECDERRAIVLGHEMGHLNSFDHLGLKLLEDGWAIITCCLAVAYPFLLVYVSGPLGYLIYFLAACLLALLWTLIMYKSCAFIWLCQETRANLLSALYTGNVGALIYAVHVSKTWPLGRYGIYYSKSLKHLCALTLNEG